jgi:hypothetical protein
MTSFGLGAFLLALVWLAASGGALLALRKPWPLGVFGSIIVAGLALALSGLALAAGAGSKSYRPIAPTMLLARLTLQPTPAGKAYVVLALSDSQRAGASLSGALVIRARRLRWKGLARLAAPAASVQLTVFPSGGADTLRVGDRGFFDLGNAAGSLWFRALVTADEITAPIPGPIPPTAPRHYAVALNAQALELRPE